MKTLSNKTASRKVIAFLFHTQDREVDEYKIGILQYARPNHNWVFIRADQRRVVEDLARSDGMFDGGIGEFGDRQLWKAARKAPYPVVNLYGGRGFKGIPRAGVDDRETGRLAARHLMHAGLRHFAYFGLKQRGFSSARWAGFAGELLSYGHCPLRFQHFKDYPAADVTPAIFVPEETRFGGWLLALPKPCGIFCCDDMRAEWLSIECSNLRLKVPDEIAILGVDDNQVHCAAAVPPLSSIRINSRQAGYEAARMLDALMQEKKPPADVLLPPGPLVSRESSDLLAVENPHLRKALFYIRSQAGRQPPINVEEVVAQSGYCRRILETKFRDELGRTLFQEIRRVRIEQAQALLRETTLTLEDIAPQTGWSSAAHFGIEFKKVTGMSPGVYRKHWRISKQ